MKDYWIFLGLLTELSTIITIKLMIVPVTEAIRLAYFDTLLTE